MTDTLTQSQRFASMSANKSKGTKPEVIVRRLVHSLGYRYRLHRRDLPGCPDMIFPSRKKVIFINGCYWHRHNCIKGHSIPETRKDFWLNKFDRTIQRDKQNRNKLRKQGWRHLTLWECRLKSPKELEKQIINFLET